MSEKNEADPIDQLPDDQHKLDRNVEIGENYAMSQLNTQAFKTLNITSNANSKDAVKHKKGESKHMLWIYSYLVNVQLKRQKIISVKRLVTIPEFVETNLKRKQNIDMLNNQSKPQMST